MGKEWNETLGLVVKPLLIAKEEVDDHHRCANKVILEVLLEKSESVH
jgi:hypothetical protein